MKNPTGQTPAVYVAFRPEVLKGLPIDAKRLTAEVTCSRCGCKALATISTLGQFRQAAAVAGRPLRVVCDECGAEPYRKADVIVAPVSEEMNRIVARDQAERN